MYYHWSLCWCRYIPDPSLSSLATRLRSDPPPGRTSGHLTDYGCRSPHPRTVGGADGVERVGAPLKARRREPVGMTGPFPTGMRETCPTHRTGQGVYSDGRYRRRGPTLRLCDWTERDAPSPLLGSNLTPEPVHWTYTLTLFRVETVHRTPHRPRVRNHCPTYPTGLSLSGTDFRTRPNTPSTNLNLRVSFLNDRVHPSVSTGFLSTSSRPPTIVDGVRDLGLREVGFPLESCKVCGGGGGGTGSGSEWRVGPSDLCVEVLGELPTPEVERGVLVVVE